PFRIQRMSIISDLINKQIGIEKAVEKALADNAILSELLAGIQSSQDPTRYNSFKVILPISENHQGTLYPQWHLFEKMLESDNSYFKDIAIQIIANLTKIDTENRFEPLFDKYFGELGGDKTMTAAHVASNAGKIAGAKPGLQSKITDKLLNIDKLHQGKQIDLIKGHAIEAFNRYFGESTEKDKKRILEFVKKEQTSRSPRTRKIAGDFLNKFGQE
ncbi:MAG: hypothetical protein PHY28_07285, partial [Dehalococcoidales bacterium]|nr:hypothetical protein [Dehalococcoidales bacterium]